MNKEIRPDGVSIYIRWSTEDQGDGTTLAVQSEACRHYVLSQGWQVRGDLIFIDDGYSGGNLDRPALTRLRQAVREGLVDCVVVFRLDRLSRSVIDTVTLVLQEWADLTHVKSAREPVDTTTAMGRQFFYMLVSYAEWERNVIRERMFSGKLRRAKEGRSPGMPAPYGYRKGPTPGTLELDEAEAAVVRLAYRLAGQGCSVRQITRHLSQHGYPTRRGAPWGVSMVSKLLHNLIYTGRLVWGRRRANPRYGKAPGERKFRAAEPHAVISGPAIPAIITPEEFEQVQAAMGERQAVAPGAAGSDHLLTGLIRCARCGRMLQFNGYCRWSYYRCPARSEQGACTAPSVPAGPVEAAVARLLCEHHAGAVVRAAAAHQEGQREALAAEQEAALKAVEAGLVRLEGQARRVDRDYRRERITAEERRHLLAAIQAEREQLRGQQADLAQLLRQARSDSPRPLPPDPWDALTPVERKELLRYFVTEIQVARPSPDQVIATITWAGEEAPA